MNFKVMKFGGTSMGTSKSIKKVIQIIRQQPEVHKKIVVVSAMSGVTDLLLTLAKQAKRGQDCSKGVQEIIDRHQKLFFEFKPEFKDSYFPPIENLGKDLMEALTNLVWIREIEEPALQDFISSFGELFSATTLSGILSATFVDTRELLVTDENFGNAQVDFALSQSKVSQFYSQSKPGIYINTGFIARSNTGRTTTLGRGGSDYTAGLLASFLETPSVQIWTDVEGIFSTDPRILDSARVLQNLSFSEAYEVAYYGGKVLYPKTMDACLPKKIDIQIGSTFNPQQIGTKVTTKQTPGIKVVSYAKNIQIVEVVFAGITSEIGLLTKIFDWIAREKISLDVVATSGDSVSFSCDKLPSSSLIQKIEAEIGLVRIFDKKELVAVIGTDITKQPVFQTILKKISEFSPKILSMNTKHTNLTTVVDEGQGKDLVVKIHSLVY